MFTQTDTAVRQKFDAAVRSGALTEAAAHELYIRLGCLAYHMERMVRLDETPDWASVAGLCSQQQAIVWLFDGPSLDSWVPFEPPQGQGQEGERLLREGMQLGFIHQAVNKAARFASLELQRYFFAAYILVDKPLDSVWYPNMSWKFAYWLECDPQVIGKLIEAATTPSTKPYRQEYAVNALGRFGDPRAFEPLMRILRDGSLDRSLRGAAARALAKLGDSRAIPALIEAFETCHPLVPDLDLRPMGEPALAALIEALQHDHARIRGGAAKALGQFGDSRAVPPLIAALSDGDHSVREAVLRALGELGDERAIAPILAHPQGIAHWHTLVALRNLEAKEAIPLLIEALKVDHHNDDIAETLDHLNVDGWALQTLFADPEARQVIESANYDFEDERVIAHWQRQLEPRPDDGNTERVSKALWILRSHPDERLIPAVLHWLNTYPKYVIEILGETGDPGVIEAILTTLVHPDEEVRREAAVALGKFRDERVTQALIETLRQDTDRFARFHAAGSLSRSQDERATLALIETLHHDPDDWVRLMTAGMLSCRGAEPVILAALYQALADPVARVRGAAIKALDALRDTSAIPLLEVLRETDTEGSPQPVWVLAELAIRNLQDDPGAARPLTKR